MLPVDKHFKNNTIWSLPDLVTNLTQHQKKQGNYLISSISTALIQYHFWPVLKQNENKYGRNKLKEIGEKGC